MFVLLVNTFLFTFYVLLICFYYQGGHGKRKKRDVGSIDHSEEGGNIKEINTEDNTKKHNGESTKVGTEQVEPSLDRVFVPWKKAIYEARKQLLRASVKSNFNKLDLIASFPHLFEILWYVSFLFSVFLAYQVRKIINHFKVC